MTREQRKYRRRYTIHCIVTGIVCFGIVYGVSYLVNVVM